MNARRGLPILAQSVSMTESLTLLHQGEEFLKESRWEDAVAAFRGSIREDADNPWPHHHLGDALGRLGHFADAITAYEQAIALSPESPWTFKNLGMALSRLERWEEAVSAYRSAIELDSSEPLIFLYLGEALTKQGRWQEALEAFFRSISLDASNAWPHHHLGDALGRLGLLAYAVTAYEHALALSPDSPWTLKNLGNALLKLNRCEEAVTAYQQSLSLVTDDAEMSLNLGTALSKLERWHEAESAYLQARLLLGDSPRIARKLGGVWLKLERWEEAADAYEQCVAAMPDDAELQRNLGIAVFKLETRKAYLKANPGARLHTHTHKDDALPLAAPDWTVERFGSRVFEIEHWIEGLIPAPSNSTPDPQERVEVNAKNARLLFILDNDFGELTTVMYLLMGQEWFGEIMVLVPERLYAINSEAFPGRTFCFQSIADVERVVESFHPDIAFLCSGYLYAMHEIFSQEILQNLVDLLAKRDCKVVTADPFLGVLSRQPISSLISIDVPDETDLALPAHVFKHLESVKAEQDAFIVEKLSGAERILRDRFHLYPAHINRTTGETSVTDARELGFFNAELVYPASLKPDSDTQPHWVFILSATDLDAQLMFEAVRGFTEIVARLLKQAIAMGRRPIFIAPEKFIRDLTREMRGQEGAELLSFCSFTRLTSLLLTAEYAFYWNSVSHTILLRSFNGLPVILFDRGHLVRNVEAIYERVVQWYYQGLQPIYMDHYQPLSLEKLNVATANFRRCATEMVRNFQRGPDPESLVQGILDAASPANGSAAR